MFASPTESTEYFIGNQIRIEGLSQGAGQLEVFDVERIDAAFTKNRFEDECGGVLSDGSYESGLVIGRDEGDIGPGIDEPLSKVGLAGDGERAHGSAMVRALNRHEAGLTLSGACPNGFQRSFDGLRAAVAEEGAVEAADLAEPFRQLFLLGVGNEVGCMDAPLGLPDEGGGETGVGVAEGVDADAGEQIEVAIAI